VVDKWESGLSGGRREPRRFLASGSTKAQRAHWGLSEWEAELRRVRVMLLVACVSAVLIFVFMLVIAANTR
jgi:hypothetical protein